MKRRIEVVTVGRSDYGLYRPILRLMKNDPDIDLGLIVGNAHLSAEGGRSITNIESDNLRIDRIMDCQPESDTSVCVAQAMARGASDCAEALESIRPDILLVLGDRFDMFAAAFAASPMTIPIAHIHGGEVTSGAIDEGFRHAITKLSHLHFASTTRAAGRIAQMGEERWRITVSGAPGLDNILSIRWHSLPELGRAIGISLPSAPILVTYHPATLTHCNTDQHITSVLSALGSIDRPIILTAPNTDMSSTCIQNAISEFTRGRPNACFVRNLGTDLYFSLMKHAVAMVGNSSSGLIEAPSLELPVVNVGDRQNGRLRARNVIDVDHDADAIRRAIDRAISPEFASSLRGLQNPYGDGHAATRIITTLKNVPCDDRLLTKYFIDQPQNASEASNNSTVHGLNIPQPTAAEEILHIER